MAVPPSAGQHVVGAQADGHQILGNNFSAGGDNIIHINDGSRDERKRCLRALFATNPVDDRAHYISFKGEVVGAAFTWITQVSVYQSWANPSSGSELIWVHGGPGMGKTMLSIFLTMELESSVDGLVLYYFCEARDPKRNTPANLLRGLIFTLVQQRPVLVKYLLPEYEVQGDALFNPDAIEPLWRILTDMIKDPSTGNVYCIIDGLDECQASIEHLEHILKKFRGYFGSGAELTKQMSRVSLNKGVFKVALISREAPEVLQIELAGVRNIQLESHTAHEGGVAESTASTDEVDYRPQGLSIYIEAKINTLAATHGFDKQTKELLCQNLQEHGDGTFLWVDMAVEQLRKNSSVDLAHSNLPSGAEGLYLLNLLQLPEDLVPLADLVLRWVTIAFRPLTTEELHEIARISNFSGLEKRQEIDQNDADETQSVSETSKTQDGIERIVALCSNLLDMNTSGEVKLVHQTAKTFLTDPASPLLNHPKVRQFHVNEGDVHGEIAQTSINYLEASVFTTGWLHLVSAEEDPWTHEKIEIDQSWTAEYPLLIYAGVYWPEHFNMATRGFVNLESPFLTPQSKAFTGWWSSAWGYAYRRDPGLAPTFQSLLHVAAFFDMIELAEFISRKPDFEKLRDKKNGELRTSAAVASFRGSVKVAALLLKSGAKQRSFGEPFVIIASQRGHAGLVDMLISNGISPDTTVQENAAYKGGRAVLRLAPEKWWHSMARIYEDKETADSVKMLALDYGGSMCALHAASIRGHEAVVRLLLRRGANIHQTTTTGWSVIHFAGLAGQPAQFALLIEHGASVTATALDGWTPLHSTAWQGKPVGAQYLLDHGAAADAATKEGLTALHLAAARGFGEVVRILLQKGANCESKTLKGLTPLHMAAETGQDNTIKVLLEHGADRSAKSTRGDTPIKLAKGGRNSSTAQLLSTYRLGAPIAASSPPPPLPGPRPSLKPEATATVTASASQASLSPYIQPSHTPSTDLQLSPSPSLPGPRPLSTSDGLSAVASPPPAAPSSQYTQPSNENPASQSISVPPPLPPSPRPYQPAPEMSQPTHFQQAPSSPYQMPAQRGGQGYVAPPTFAPPPVAPSPADNGKKSRFYKKFLPGSGR